MYYREPDGRLSPCVLSEDVPVVLESVRDLHGHFFVGLPMRHLVARLRNFIKDIDTSCCSTIEGHTITPYNHGKKLWPWFLPNVRNALLVEFKILYIWLL